MLHVACREVFALVLCPVDGLLRDMTQGLYSFTKQLSTLTRLFSSLKKHNPFGFNIDPSRDMEDMNTETCFSFSVDQIRTGDDRWSCWKGMPFSYWKDAS